MSNQGGHRRRRRRNGPRAEPCQDYYLVIDFEATTHKPVQEIIEFPALLIDATTLEYKSQYHSYVRPVIHPHLDVRCKRLTGITQVYKYAAIRRSHILIYTQI